MEEIIEGNKLIAEFVGVPAWKSYWNKEDNSDWYDTQKLKNASIKGVNTGSGSTKYLYFDSSWDWLMPVVEKIHTMEEYTEEYAAEQVIYAPILQAIPLYGIKGVWDEVVEFIKWYNKQKKNEDEKV